MGLQFTGARGGDGGHSVFWEGRPSALPGSLVSRSLLVTAALPRVHSLCLYPALRGKEHTVGAVLRSCYLVIYRLLYFSLFFDWGEIHTNTKFTILKWQFIGIWYIYNIQPPPLCSSRTFPCPKQKPHPISSHPPFPLPQPLATTNLLFVSGFSHVFIIKISLVGRCNLHTTKFTNFKCIIR